MKLTFEESTHTYTMDAADGRGPQRVPGTTDILRAAGLLDAVANIPDHYRERGSAVHAWTEADDKGIMIVDPPLIVLPYLAAWRTFREESRMEVLAVEELVGNPLYRYATKIDRRVRMGGGAAGGEEWILNIKTGGAYPHYPVQSALESMCYGVAVRRACVYLDRKTRRARLVEHKDPRDFAVAKHAISLYRAAAARAEASPWRGEKEAGQAATRLTNAACPRSQLRTPRRS